MKKSLNILFLLLAFNLSSQELVIGKERIEPGMIFIFECPQAMIRIAEQFREKFQQKLG